MPEGRGRKRKRLSIEPNASQKADICRNKGLPKGHADKKTNHHDRENTKIKNNIEYFVV